MKQSSFNMAGTIQLLGADTAQWGQHNFGLGDLASHLVQRGSKWVPLGILLRMVAKNSST